MNNRNNKQREQSSAATLICDYSMNDLNMLMVANEAAGMSGNTELNSLQTSTYKGSPDKYNQLTKLDDDEENVDFMQMFNQYQHVSQGRQQQPMSKADSHQAQVHYYQNDQNHSERISNLHGDNRTQQMIHLQDGQRGSALRPPPSAGKGKKGNMRPSSATVAGAAGRFLTNQQQMRTAYGGMQYRGSSGNNQIDQTSHSYQQPAHLTNTNSIGKLAGFGSQSTTHQGSNRNVQMHHVNSLKPPTTKKKMVRPMSAAKNQMKPAPQLQSVTTFTFQKAKQNQNQRSFVPESLKNTDKERLYEDKINLKKQLNEYMKENQVLKTQVQTHHNMIKKKDDTIQGMMRQLFHHPSASASSANLDSFLTEFQKREIQHQQHIKTTINAAPQSKVANPAVSSNSNVQTLKQKLKDVNELINQRDRELADLKQTLKFTKIKEYEAELALNVQESQRLRYLLEQEMTKPKVDPRIVQGLRHQLSQYQEVIQNFQRNQNLQQENYEKLNKKMIAQIKKMAKSKEARKRLLEKNKRLERKIEILQAKVANSDKQSLYTQNSRGAFSDGGKQSQGNLLKMQRQFQSKFDQQTTLIEKLLIKMQNCGIEVTQDELMNMQQESMQQIDEENEDEHPRGMDLVVTFGAGSKNSSTKQINDAYFDSFDHLKQTLQQQFSIGEQFYIKYLNEDGSALELTGNNFDQIKELGTLSKIRLEIELLNEQDPSNYEEDEFEEAAAEKEFRTPIMEDEVNQYFHEMRFVLQIKKVKHGDALKYILHGLRENDKKIKQVSIQTLSDRIRERVGFSDEISNQLARYLIEKPSDDNGKVMMLPNHDLACTALRKDIHDAIQGSLESYTILNGLAITQLLKQINLMFEEKRFDLEQELEDTDYEDTRVAKMTDIYKAMKMVIGHSFVDDMENDVKEFLEYLAMYFSESLDKVRYEKLISAFDEDFSFNEKSKWQTTDNADFEPSSEEDEMESEPSLRKEEAGEGGDKNTTVDELEQNVLLEKVDEILMQIVQRLPEQNKIRTLTHCMMPYLQQVYDQEQQRQFLIIFQDAFIEFLVGDQQNQLGLQLDQQHIICLLHLLMQEDERGNQRYILFDEFIELVKTYMKKELIMKQSVSLGINYGILSKESVEFLFQIRSSLMQDNNINENSGDEDDLMNQSSPQKKQQKSVPIHIREIFSRIIQTKNVQLKQGEQNSAVEVMDFDQMLDLLFMRMSIQCPSAKSQEELKYLLCLDFKYLEMVMLVKFDKVMHDLDYISIDLLRQAQDSNLDDDRKADLNRLRRTRDNQLGKLKQIKEEKSQRNGPDNFIVQEEIGVTQTKPQDKKRKRPDDKKQLLSKKIGSNARSNNRRSKNEDEIVDMKASNTRYEGQKLMSGAEVYQGDFDNIDVDVDIADMNRKASSDEEDYEEDFLQDDIPIDDDDDEDGIISDNYENLADRKPETAIIKSHDSAEFRPVVQQQSPTDEQIISVGHSDDMEESRKFMIKDSSRQMMPDMSMGDNADEEAEDMIDDNYPEEVAAIIQEGNLPDMDDMNDQDPMDESEDEDIDEDDSSSSKEDMDGSETSSDQEEQDCEDMDASEEEMEKALLAQQMKQQEEANAEEDELIDEYMQEGFNVQGGEDNVEDGGDDMSEEDQYSEAMEMSQRSQQKLDQLREESQRQSSQRHSQSRPAAQSDRYSEVIDEIQRQSLQQSERYTEHSMPKSSQHSSRQNIQNPPYFLNEQEPSNREMISQRQTQSYNESQGMFNPPDEEIGKNAFSAPDSSSSRQDKSQTESQYSQRSSKSQKSRKSRQAIDPSQDENNASSYHSSKQYSGQGGNSPIAQDFQAPEEVDDFAVEVPSHMNVGGFAHEEKKSAQFANNFVDGNNEENSVQVVEDNYYVEDDFEDDLDPQENQQVRTSSQQSKLKLRQDSQRQSHQSERSRASKKSKRSIRNESAQNQDDDDDDYEF